MPISRKRELEIERELEKLKEELYDRLFEANPDLKRHNGINHNAGTHPWAPPLLLDDD